MALRYITLAELINQIPDNLQGLLTDDSANGLVRDDEIATSAGEWAEQMVDSFLSTRYTIPTVASDDTVPELVKQSIFTLAKYRLFQRRDAITEQIRMQYKDTIDFLKGLQTGALNLPILDASDTVETATQIDVESAEEVESDFGKWI
jgi:phage gp36-like protein